MGVSTFNYNLPSPAPRLSAQGQSAMKLASPVSCHNHQLASQGYIKRTSLLMMTTRVIACLETCRSERCLSWWPSSSRWCSWRCSRWRIRQLALHMPHSPHSSLSIGNLWLKTAEDNSRILTERFYLARPAAAAVSSIPRWSSCSRCS